VSLVFLTPIAWLTLIGLFTMLCFTWAVVRVPAIKASSFKYRGNAHRSNQTPTEALSTWYLQKIPVPEPIKKKLP